MAQTHFSDNIFYEGIAVAAKKEFKSRVREKIQNELSSFVEEIVDEVASKMELLLKKEQKLMQVREELILRWYLNDTERTI